MLWSISETVNARDLKLVPLCSAPWKLTSKDFWSSMNNRKPLSKQKCVLRKCCGYLRNGECYSFQTIGSAIVFLEQEQQKATF